MPEGKDGICYREGLVVNENYQMCDITNRKILDQLKDQKPQATFSCNAKKEECNFQFWVDQKESFYCALDTCSWTGTAEHDRNTTSYECKNIKCRCIPGRMLCGEEGSIDIGDFLKEEIKGPASFSSISTDGGSPADGSKFEEPAMNDLISSVFGDKSITLNCHAGECLYRTDVPGYERPIKKINTPLIAGVIAGYLTMHAGTPHTPIAEDSSIFADRDGGMNTRASSAMAVKSIPSISNVSMGQSSLDSPSESLLRPKGKRRASIKQQQDRQLFTRKKSDIPGTPRTTDDESLLLDNTRESTQQWLRLSRQQGAPPPQVMDDPHQLPPAANGGTGTDLDILVAAYATSDIAGSLHEDMAAAIQNANSSNGHPNGLPNGSSPASGKVKGYRKVGWIGQFRVLSTRTWRNLYRNPMLMLTHYAIAILLAVFLGFLFYGLTDDIKGFQNRLGLFFFLLALFGFSTLTSLTVFAPERLLFVRERAKGYYAPISYFAAKVIFDIVPLRLIPPIILGAVVYPMTGLIPAWAEFWKFVLFLVLFNLAAATVTLFIGIVFKNGGVANLLGSLVMLFSLLFSGFLLNQESVPKFVGWLQKLSIFHYAFEGLIVNEVKYLSLVDHKYGLDIEVPGSAILSSFGFNVLALWEDCIGLGVFAGIFVVLAYAAMHLLLVERR
ncbi:FAD-dependent urate hydroxylase [Cryomyces antarcticus]|nr:FAD-dependent urate hydroxylase [Cryomyces antarcticus]